MANRGELNKRYEHIEADDGEMSVFRGRLKQQLPQRQPWGAWWKWAMPTIALAAALLLFLALPKQGEPVNFAEQSPDQLALLVANHSNRQQLKEQAWQAWQTGDTPTRGGAAVVLCLTLETESALQQAVAALTLEQRPAFRAFYLEHIIDMADGYRFDPERIDALMEREENQLCLYLFREWLKIA